MKVTICTTYAGDPEVHATGCRDIKRGYAARKYQDIDFDTEIASELDATTQYWDNGILDEAYGEGEYYRYSTKLEAARGHMGTMKYAPCVKGLPAEDEEIVKELSENPSETAGDQVDSKVEENTEEGEKMTETQTPATETTSPTGRTTTGDNGHGRKPKADPKPTPPRRGSKATTKTTGTKGAAKTDPKLQPKPEPKVQAEKLNAKRALADEVIAALGELAKGKSAEDALTISKWVHHLPADHAAWVKVLPNPDRSDWK